MLGITRSFKHYKHSVLTELHELAKSRPDQIREYQDAISKMLILNLDPLIPVISPLYPLNGRHAEMQVEIFRSLVLMQHCKITLNNWVDKLTHNPVLRIIAGFDISNMPKTSSYYDFINRVMRLDERPVIKAFHAKPKKNLKKGEKLPPKHSGIVDKIVNKLIDDEDKFISHLSRRPERFLQKIFARVAVDSSINMGIVPTAVNISGDGTCVETGASHYGKKVCQCVENRIYKCTCDRKFSDPGRLGEQQTRLLRLRPAPTPLGAGTAIMNVTSTAIPGTLSPPTIEILNWIYLFTSAFWKQAGMTVFPLFLPWLSFVNSTLTYILILSFLTALLTTMLLTSSSIIGISMLLLHLTPKIPVTSNTLLLYPLTKTVPLSAPAAVK